MSAQKISVAIVGATGYTGMELLYWLSRHPHIHISIVTSESKAGETVSDYFSESHALKNLRYQPFAVTDLLSCQLVFFATPHGFAMQHAPALLHHGIKVIDLSADYRLQDVPDWEQWYGVSHQSPEWIDRAVYGLTEIQRDAVKTAQLIANPGCYPTAVQLGYYPLIRHGCIRLDSLIADAKSGVSGAGKTMTPGLMFAELSENFYAYKTEGHRHLPEMVEQLDHFAASQATSQTVPECIASALTPSAASAERYQNQQLYLTFTPHLLPVQRGILATLYAELMDPAISLATLRSIYQHTYQQEPFVQLLPEGVHPQLQHVVRTNACHINIFRPQGGSRLVVQVAMDNLVKGAAGQAVQNMNIMLGWPETCGLV